jgi:peptide/nickel transport system permease protein
VTFLLLRLIPGDPAEIMLQDHGTQDEVMAMKAQLGLDKPFVQQYFVFLENILKGDLGTNYFNKRKVTEEVLSHLVPTLYLAAAAIFLGVVSSYTRSKAIQSLISGFSLLGLSIPSFWLAPILIIIFSIHLNVLPVSGQEGPLSLVLPTLTLGFSLSAVLQRITRTSMLETLDEDYIRVARAKGLKERLVLFKHALKNASGPIITVLGLQIGAIATGVVMTEAIFDWPGLGLLLYSALKSRNYPVVQGCVMVTAVIYVVVNLLTDMAYFWINPRLRDIP